MCKNISGPFFFGFGEQREDVMSQSISDMPLSQRPYEKCLKDGESSLSDLELIAVILRCGTQGRSSLSLASDILRMAEERSNSGLSGLMHLSYHDLRKINGVGKVKAVQLKCIGELSKRIAASAARSGLCYQNPATIADFYMERLRHENQEMLYCMMLDSKNHFIGDSLLSKGTVNSTVITPREIFVEALRQQAVHIIIVHNHPSGDPVPSRSDLVLTQRVYLSGQLLGIALLDHIIIGDHRYVSLNEQGIFEEFQIERT